MAGGRPEICASITDDNLAAVREIAPLVDLFEVRIDLIGEGWRDIAAGLEKPWIACNRRIGEGGAWCGSEAEWTTELLKALDMGTTIIDVEITAPGVETLVAKIRGRAEVLLSHHDTERTPPPGEMREIIERQIKAGADICKLVTTARSFADNLAVLELNQSFPGARVVAFAMGDRGQMSRVLCPLVGGEFTYASISEGSESAAGQITVKDLRMMYGMVRR